MQSDEPPDDALAEIGTCRSNLARSEARGRVSVERVPLSADVLGWLGAVVATAEALEDEGKRDYPHTESGGDLERARAVKLVGAKVLAGELDDRSGAAEASAGLTG